MKLEEENKSVYRINKFFRYVAVLNGKIHARKKCEPISGNFVLTHAKQVCVNCRAKGRLIVCFVQWGDFSVVCFIELSRS